MILVFVSVGFYYFIIFMLSFIFLSGIMLSANLSDCPDINIRLLDETSAVQSAHVCVNDTLVGVSDSSGNITLHDVGVGDTISVSHLLYETVSFTVRSINDTTITLFPKLFSIQEAKYTKDFDYDIFKSKMRAGLSVRSHFGLISVSSIDTLIFKGNIPCICGFKYKVPILSRRKMEIIWKEEFPGYGYTFGQSKAIVKGCLSNVQYFTDLACKCRINKGFRVEYRGTDDRYEVFYFFIPPQDIGSYKCRGFIYIDSETGVLDHIEATATSLTESCYSYDLSVRFQYFDSSNTIRPKTIAQMTYYCNEDGSIYQTHRRHIVLD